MFCGKIPVKKTANGEDSFLGFDYNFVPSQAFPAVIIASDSDKEIISIAEKMTMHVSGNFQKVFPFA